MRMKAIVQKDKAGRPRLQIIGDPDEAKGTNLFRLITELGDTHYEGRHGIGTAVGFYPAVPDRASSYAIGDEVELLSLTGEIVAGGRPLFFVAVRVLRTAAEVAAAQAAQTAMAQSWFDAVAGIIESLRHVRGFERVPPAVADIMEATFAGKSHHRRVRIAPVVEAIRAGKVFGTEAEAVADLMSACGHKPTLAMRATRREFWA